MNSPRVSENLRTALLITSDLHRRWWSNIEIDRYLESDIEKKRRKESQGQLAEHQNQNLDALVKIGKSSLAQPHSLFFHVRPSDTHRDSHNHHHYDHFGYSVSPVNYLVMSKPLLMVKVFIVICRGKYADYFNWNFIIIFFNHAWF